LGSSLFLNAVGAILRYAVTATMSGVPLTTILMIVGAADLLLSLLLGSRRGWVMSERVLERNPRDEPPAA